MIDIQGYDDIEPYQAIIERYERQIPKYLKKMSYEVIRGDQNEDGEWLASTVSEFAITV